MEKKHKNCISIITIVEWRDTTEYLMWFNTDFLCYLSFMYPSQQVPDDK